MIFRRKTQAAVADPVQAPPVTQPVSADVEQKEVDPSVPRKKILVVDDDPVTVKALSHKLESRGFQVVTAKDGSQALNATRRERPDLMLLDVNLPPDVGCVEWNGFLVAQWLQRMDDGKHMPVIVMSADDREEYKERAMLSGATAFFCKLTDNDQMLATIDSALRGSAGTVAKPTVFEI